MALKYALFLSMICSTTCFTEKLVQVKLISASVLSKRSHDGSKFPDVERLFNINGGDVRKLIVRNTDITSINSTLLEKLINLHVLEIVHNKKLTRVEADTFSSNRKIASLVLSQNSISYISSRALTGLFQGPSHRGTIHLDGNKIRELPRFLGEYSGLTKMWLDNNPLERFQQKQFSGMLSMYFLSVKKTRIQKIERKAFQESANLHHIELSQNKHLSVIDDEAFSGLNLKFLDLNGTSLSTLPIRGLESLRTLSIDGVTSLYHIPDTIVGIQTLQRVRVDDEKRYLCCAFVMRRARILTLNGKNQKRFPVKATPCPTPQTTTLRPDGRYKRAARKNVYNGKTATHADGSPHRGSSVGLGRNALAYNFDDFFDGGGGGGSFDSGGRLATHPPNGSTICGKQDGAVHMDNYTEVECTPGPDPLRPCDDIMGNTGLTVVSWFVATTGLIANAFVLTIVSLSRRTSTVTKFLLQNLSLADLCLSLYLFILVCGSTATSGSYYNYVRRWQYGGVCELEGFLAMSSSQLSVLVLFIITIERYFSIVHALKFNLRFSILKARWCIAIAWLLSLIVALLPILGVNTYTNVAICLPFRTTGTADRVYIGVVMTSNVVLFIGVSVSYARMYGRIKKRAIHPNDGGRADGDIAKRMALLVFTDFACWMPIAFVAMVSTFAGPRVLDMDMSKSKYLLVIFFPINAICNPILYALTTSTFKKDLKDIINRKCPFLYPTFDGVDQQDDNNTHSRRLTSLSGLYQGLYKRISSKISKDDIAKVRIPLLARGLSEIDDIRPSSVPVSRKETNNARNMKQFLKLVNESEERLKVEEACGSNIKCSNTHVTGHRDLNHCHVTQCSTDRFESKKLPLVRVRSNSTGRIDQGSISPAFKEITIDYEFSTESFMMAKETSGL